jgi:hypothetical protein
MEGRWGRQRAETAGTALRLAAQRRHGDLTEWAFS